MHLPISSLHPLANPKLQSPFPSLLPLPTPPKKNSSRLTLIIAQIERGDFTALSEEDPRLVRGGQVRYAVEIACLNRYQGVGVGVGVSNVYCIFIGKVG